MCCINSVCVVQQTNVPFAHETHEFVKMQCWCSYGACCCMHLRSFEHDLQTLAEESVYMYILIKLCIHYLYLSI